MSLYSDLPAAVKCLGSCPFLSHQTSGTAVITIQTPFPYVLTIASPFSDNNFGVTFIVPDISRYLFSSARNQV